MIKPKAVWTEVEGSTSFGLPQKKKKKNWLRVGIT
jgi:hypothetical protein